MTSSLLKSVIVAAVCFILIGIAMSFAPQILTGFETIRTNPSAGNYTALTTVIQFGPTMIILGFIISVALVGFMGIRAIGSSGK